MSEQSTEFPASRPGIKTALAVLAVGLAVVVGMNWTALKAFFGV